MTQAEVTPDEIDAKLFRARVPAIAMLRTPKATDPGTPGCWFGGEPTLPAEIPWPYYKPTEREAYGIRYEDPDLTIPMHFLVQINLAHCPRVLGLPLLPKTGTIFVFYDPAVAQATDGIAFTTGTGCKVIYVAEDVQACAPRPAPPIPDLSSTEVAMDYLGTSSFTHWPFEFVVVDTYPVGDPPGAAKGVSNLLWDRREELELQRSRRLGDFLGAETADQRERVTGGFHLIFGSSRREHFPSAEWLSLVGETDLPPLTEEHVLLLRFPGDEDIGHQTENKTALEFWVTQADLEAQHFDNVAVWKA